MDQETNSKHRGRAVSKRPYGIQLPNIRAWRMYRCMTQTKLAALAGTTLPTVNGIESRAKSTSFSMVGKLAKALDISIDDLRYELPPRPQPPRVRRTAE